MVTRAVLDETEMIGGGVSQISAPGFSLPSRMGTQNANHLDATEVYQAPGMPVR